MTILFAASTIPINPPGAAPLTVSQVWAGLEMKRKNPGIFLTVIDTCEILEDDGESVLREVKFKDGHGIGMAPTIGPKVQERITHIKPLTQTAGSGIEFFQSVGSASRVLNIVSTGADGELYLTFTFEWEHPEIQAGSREAVEKQREYQDTAPRGVGGTLDEIRKLVGEGKL